MIAYLKTNLVAFDGIFFEVPANAQMCFRKSVSRDHVVACLQHFVVYEGVLDVRVQGFVWRLPVYVRIFGFWAGPWIVDIRLASLTVNSSATRQLPLEQYLKR